MITIQKVGDIKPNEAVKKTSHSPLNENYNEEIDKKSVFLTKEQISFLIQKCKYEIIGNKQIIQDLKESKKKMGKKIEIACWKEENKFIQDIICCLNNKISYQVVLQELTPSQEDYVLENSLEMMREAKNG
jgi:hypothetical protein